MSSVEDWAEIRRSRRLERLSISEIARVLGISRNTGCRPADRVEVDKAAMLTLPPVGPSIGWRTSTRLPRDHYVRLDGNDYSAHPVAVGRHRDHRRSGAGSGLAWRHPGRRP